MDAAFKLEDEMRFKIKIGGSNGGKTDGGSKPAVAALSASTPPAELSVIGHAEMEEL